MSSICVVLQYLKFSDFVSRLSVLESKGTSFQKYSVNSYLLRLSCFGGKNAHKKNESELPSSY